MKDLNKKYKEEKFINNFEIAAFAGLILIVLIILFPKKNLEKYVFLDTNNYTLNKAYLKALIKANPDDSTFIIYLIKLNLKLYDLKQAHKLITKYKNKISNLEFKYLYYEFLKKAYFKTKNYKYKLKAKNILKDLINKEPQFVLKESKIFNFLKIEFEAYKKSHIVNTAFLNLALYFKNYQLAKHLANHLYEKHHQLKYLIIKAQIESILKQFNKSSKVYLAIFKKTNNIKYFKKSFNILIWNKKYKQALLLSKEYTNRFLKQSNFNILMDFLKFYLAIGDLKDAEKLSLKIENKIYKTNYFNEQLYNYLYKSFIYNGNLANAYKIIKKSLKHKHNFLKWKEKLAEVSLWSGKSLTAYKNYMYLYERTKEKKFIKILLMFPYNQEKLLKLKIKIYLKQFKNNNFNHTLELTHIYYNVFGEVKKAENILKTAYIKTHKKEFFKQYVKYAILSEDIPLIKKNINFLKKSNIEDKIKIAYLFININDFKDAYNILKYVKQPPENIIYYKLLVYTANQLHKFNKVLNLLNYMYKNNLMTKSTFSLYMSYYYSIKDYKKLEILLHNAIVHYNFNLYKDYINILIINKKYKKALNVLEKYKYYLNKKEYIKLKAYLYYKLQKYNLAAKYYEQLLYFKLNTSDINDIFWFSINTENYYLFKKIENKIHNDYLLALAYFNFNKINKAYYEMKKVKLNSLDKYMTFINILEIRGLNAYKYRLKAFNFSNNLIKKNPSLLKDPDFLINYIHLSFYFYLPNKINKLLNIAKKILTKQELINLKIDYYFKLNEYDRLYYIKNYKKGF